MTIDSKEATSAREAKPMLHLVPPLAVRAVARVMEYGAKKHGAYNYVNCSNPALYIDAALRHLNEQVTTIHNTGDTSKLSIDEESGLPSLAHALASVMIAVEIYMKKAGVEDVADI